MADETGVGFGAVLRRLRRAAGLTQEELATRAGLSARGIADLERGVRQTPRRDTVALLAAALEASAEDAATLATAARRPSGAPVLASGSSNENAKQHTPLHNLPIQPTPLLGREEHLTALATHLRREGARLVTVTGPGGIGKTRLAIQVAANLLDDYPNDYPDGVWFVRLSRLTDPGLVLPTVAQILDLKEHDSHSPLMLLQTFLAGKRLLLILDNFEQVVGAAGEIGALLATCPTLRILVTSRLPLHVRAEREYPLGPLALPDPHALPPPDELAQYAAVALFLERARATKPEFALTAANATAIAEICFQLDGLPLAIELAATRVKHLPPRSLLAQLPRRLDLLSGGARDVEERQQTLRNTLAWSERLLSPEERILFRRLAVFVGGCTLSAAQTVCAAPEGSGGVELDEPLRSSDVLASLSALVDHNLAQVREEGDEVRFSMLQVVREYALERLVASGEGGTLRQAHLDYYLTLAEQVSAKLNDPDIERWLELLDHEHDNLRAALDWARAEAQAHRDGKTPEGALRLAEALVDIWKSCGYLRAGRLWLEELMSLATR